MADKLQKRDEDHGSATIALDGRSAQFVEHQVTSGQYDSPSAVVEAGLRLLEEHQRKVAVLEDALIEGELSGEAEPFDNELFLNRMRQKHGR
jgi:antitoxin ParD1/3/4